MSQYERDDLLNELLAKPVGKVGSATPKPTDDFTRALVVTDTTVEVTISDEAGTVTETKARAFIREEGLDPDEWEISTWYKGKYGQHEIVLDEDGNPALDEFGVVRETYSMETVKYHFRKVLKTESVSTVDVLEMLEWVNTHLATYEASDGLPTGVYGAIVGIGDMQFGKIDGDGPAGTLARAIACIDRAALHIRLYSEMHSIGEILVAFLGDHLEGFVSQNGANVFRTVLPFNEQIRLFRRVVIYALGVFAPLAAKVKFAAVPGNHGEAVRFNGTGTTRYDDSHDTESLIAVADMAAMMPETFGHVEFLVPDTDELLVLTELAGTNIALHHGHKFGNGKDAVFKWWQGQAFNRDSLMSEVDLLLCGHNHHEYVESDGDRTVVQTPALESESTWFRHQRGTGGSPGIMLLITKDHKTPIKHLIQADA